MGENRTYIFIIKIANVLENYLEQAKICGTDWRIQSVWNRKCSKLYGSLRQQGTIYLKIIKNWKIILCGRVNVLELRGWFESWLVLLLSNIIKESTGQTYFVFCRLYPLSLQPSRQCLATTCHLWTNTISQMRACLSIGLERFRGSQTEDERGPLSI